MERPPPTIGLRHIALFVCDLDAAVDFYTRLMGMAEEWRPDPDNVYLTSGNDNLALHRVETQPPSGALDHIGFFLAAPEYVDSWHHFLQREKVTIQTPPRTHRDGARSFYCVDPAGNRVQVIYHPPIVTARSA